MIQKRIIYIPSEKRYSRASKICTSSLIKNTNYKKKSPSPSIHLFLGKCLRNIYLLRMGLFKMTKLTIPTLSLIRLKIIYPNLSTYPFIKDSRVSKILNDKNYFWGHCFLPYRLRVSINRPFPNTQSP